MFRRLSSVAPLSVSSLRYCADARYLCLTLALAFAWSFVAAPTAIAAEEARQDYVQHQPKPLPHPKNLGSRPYNVPTPMNWLASLFSSRPKSSPAFVRPAVNRPFPASLSQLSEVGVWGGTSSPSQIDGWKQELTSHPVAERAAVLHLWLGEWQMGRNEQPETAIKHFRAVQHLTGVKDRLHGLAAYDTAIALFREGAYQQDAKAFYSLCDSRNLLRGYDCRRCALWYRHAAACAGYHASHARLGIPEPPKLDPFCGGAALAASLRALGLPSDRKTVLAHCRVTGGGSNLQDLADAGLRLGVSVRMVSADDVGLMRLPKPLIAHVEQDHFISVIRADKFGVSYLCSDCGPWPGGRVDLTWAQWRAMGANAYGAVVKPGSEWDHVLAALSDPHQRSLFQARPIRVASNGPISLATHQLAFLDLELHVAQLTTGQFYICDRLFTTLNCPDGEICCPVDSSGSSGGSSGGSGGSSHSSGSPPTPAAAGSAGSAAGDPVNLATGEEDYRPAPDITVYNPIGPSVTWQRYLESLSEPVNGTITEFGPL